MNFNSAPTEKPDISDVLSSPVGFSFQLEREVYLLLSLRVSLKLIEKVPQHRSVGGLFFFAFNFPKVFVKKNTCFLR